MAPESVGDSPSIKSPSTWQITSSPSWRFSICGYLHLSKLSKIVQITAQMAEESCPTGKSSERKCLIVTLSARLAQSTRLGVPLVYFSAKPLSKPWVVFNPIATQMKIIVYSCLIYVNIFLKIEGCMWSYWIFGTFVRVKLVCPNMFGHSFTHECVRFLPTMYLIT